MTHARWLVPVMLSMAAALAPAPASAQRLGGVSRAVHGGGGGGGGYRGGGGGGYRGGGYGYRGYGGGYGGVGVQIGSPMVGLYYPYYFGYAGVGVRRAAMAPDRSFDGPAVVGIVDASAGYVFDAVVHGQISGEIRLANIIAFEGRYGVYFEQTRDVIDAIGIGRLAIAFPFVSDEVVQFRGGLVGALYHDAAGVELGYGGALDLEVYPVAPLVIRAEGSVGALGQAVFLDGRATLGMQVDRGELYVGYQVFAVDPFVSGGTALHGPIAGVRVWIS